LCTKNHCWPQWALLPVSQAGSLHRPPNFQQISKPSSVPQMCWRMRKANRTQFCTGGGKQREPNILPSSLSTFRPSQQERGWGNWVIWRTGAQNSQSYLAAKSVPSKQAALGVKQSASHWLGTLFPQWSSYHGDCSLQQKFETPIAMPFAAWAPCCLNFSVGPHQALSLHNHSSWPETSDTGAGCPQTPWPATVPCFQVPRVAQDSNHRPSQEMALGYSALRYGEQQNGSHCHTNWI
jgi:hypothetical protein